MPMTEGSHTCPGPCYACERTAQPRTRSMDPLPFTRVMSIALEEAREIIRDGAADELTEVDLDLATVALRHVRHDRRPSAEQADALVAVVALGAEYLANLDDDDDDPDRAAALAQLRSHDDAQSAVRYWISTLV